MEHTPTEKVQIFNAADTEGGSSDNLFAAVIDSMGVTVYQNPKWDGLTTTTAAVTLSTLAPYDWTYRTHMSQDGKVIDAMQCTGQLTCP